MDKQRRLVLIRKSCIALGLTRDVPAVDDDPIVSTPDDEDSDPLPLDLRMPDQGRMRR